MYFKTFSLSPKNGPFGSLNFSYSDHGKYHRSDLHQAKESIYIPLHASEQKEILALTLKQITVTQIVLESFIFSFL